MLSEHFGTQQSPWFTIDFPCQLGYPVYDVNMQTYFGQPRVFHGKLYISTAMWIYSKVLHGEHDDVEAWDGMGYTLSILYILADDPTLNKHVMAHVKPTTQE